MTTTFYPMIANCNYESEDGDTIHRARLAADNLIDIPETLSDALAELEEALEEELSEEGEFRRGEVSHRIIDDAECAVVAAYGDGPDGAMWDGCAWSSTSDYDATWEAPSLFSCESGEVTGEGCQWRGDDSELTKIEYIPDHQRASHEAAGNRGRYPFNGAIRMLVCPNCREALVDNDWCVEV